MNFLSILPQSGPAETTDYFIAGYVIFFIVMGLYLLSLYIRRRNLEQELAMLEETRDD
jgi:uncharacterized membrane protein YciS (DUF1049 family)